MVSVAICTAIHSCRRCRMTLHLRATRTTLLHCAHRQSRRATPPRSLARQPCGYFANKEGTTMNNLSVHPLNELLRRLDFTAKQEDAGFMVASPTGFMVASPTGFMVASPTGFMVASPTGFMVA
jgi:hypothetical protein